MGIPDFLEKVDKLFALEPFVFVHHCRSEKKNKKHGYVFPKYGLLYCLVSLLLAGEERE